MSANERTGKNGKARLSLCESKGTFLVKRHAEEKKGIAIKVRRVTEPSKISGR